MKRMHAVCGAVTVLALVAISAASDLLPPTAARMEGEPSSESVGTIHRSSERLVESVLDTTLAFLSEDPIAARAGLDRVKESTPQLHPDDDAAFGSEMINLDRAFHVTIDLSREHVTAGRMAAGFDQFVWVQRACVKCHGMAREAGRLPIPTNPPARTE